MAGLLVSYTQRQRPTAATSCVVRRHAPVHLTPTCLDLAYHLKQRPSG